MYIECRCSETGDVAGHSLRASRLMLRGKQIRFRLVLQVELHCGYLFLLCVSLNFGCTTADNETVGKNVDLEVDVFVRGGVQ